MTCDGLVNPSESKLTPSQDPPPSHPRPKGGGELPSTPYPPPSPMAASGFVSRVGVEGRETEVGAKGLIFEKERERRISLSHNRKKEGEKGDEKDPFPPYYSEKQG